MQYLHYLPYGQLFVNQQVAGHDERYKFTGKERDAETGYDYFGARYQDLRLSIEGKSSRNAQYFGWRMGFYNNSPVQQSRNTLRSFKFY